jgi:chemotaxis protein CheD
VTVTTSMGSLVLSPGQFHFGQGDQRISTLLGSCVAVTFWHPGLLAGGMCHYLLPRRREAGWNGVEPLDGRYADEAIEMFRQKMTATLTVPTEYQVKVFGGGHQFFNGQVGAGSDIPARNVEAAEELLEGLGVRVMARHVGGAGPRQIVLHLATGEVWVRHTPAVEGAN